MSFETIFMHPIGTLSFLFYVNQWVSWKLFQMTFETTYMFQGNRGLCLLLFDGRKMARISDNLCFIFQTENFSDLKQFDLSYCKGQCNSTYHAFDHTFQWDLDHSSIPLLTTLDRKFRKLIYVKYMHYRIKKETHNNTQSFSLHLQTAFN